MKGGRPRPSCSAYPLPRLGVRLAGVLLAGAILAVALLGSALLGSGLLGACRLAREPERRFGALPLVVYSSRPEELLRFLTDEYRDRTAFPISLIRGGPAELLSRLESESEKPLADLLWLGEGELAAAGDYLEAAEPRQAVSEKTRALLGELALVRGGPNAGAARAFLDFLYRPETARALAARFPSP